eukprot:CAMPEP_0206451616 /NCGR_PEP_ID=MMETSP0324_2-20121206/19450_1 /ASSEMBLY_ACC=CAM_ASM_000836 /TAXON_ID=2866 /ORGANISM="Crypthecodinium cohnii, Strain Seligo" /LENGTH=128 /DNA_ID=CAMNT_0053921537 /DNA_START=195 /DNA_END=582 /DNA_ORIENTATION=+
MAPSSENTAALSLSPSSLRGMRGRSKLDEPSRQRLFELVAHAPLFSAVGPDERSDAKNLLQPAEGLAGGTQETGCRRGTAICRTHPAIQRRPSKSGRLGLGDKQFPDHVATLPTQKVMLEEGSHSSRN